MRYLGKVFKSFRERKGLKTAEISEGIVSPQFLRKFERGDSNISLTNYLFLLDRMNLSVEEFLYEYPGATVDSWIRQAEHELDIVLHSGKSLDFKKLIHTYEENWKKEPTQRNQHLLLISKNLYNQIYQASLEVDILLVTDYLRKVEKWGRYEFFLAIYSLMPFEADELFLLVTQTFRRKSTKENSFMPSAFDFLLHVCYRFILLELVDYAEEIMSLYEEMKPKAVDLYHLPFDTYAEFLQGLILIQKNDARGIERCQKIIHFFQEIVRYDDYANRLNIVYESAMKKSELLENS